jgi:SAM-dependent methyltransferase
MHMSVATAPVTAPAPRPAAVAVSRPGLDLFLISVLLLFLELACIRWFPAHVLFMTFFTNTVLLACFLGMSIGCLAAGHKTNYLSWTPALLALALVSAYLIEGMLLAGGSRYIDVGGQDRPQLVFFGAEHQAGDLASFRIPIELVVGYFFVVIALALVGPGQELGRALNRIPNRVQAYTINILGSLAGIVCFALFSWLQLSPFWWFLPVVVGLAYFLRPRPPAVRPVSEWWVRLAFLGLILLTAGYQSGVQKRAGGLWAPGWLADLAGTGSNPEEDDKFTKENLWSPYYRIGYEHYGRYIAVNLIGHQMMYGKDHVSPEYALPYLLDRDVRRTLGEQPRPVEKVLIIGAGSGNDVSRALQWGAKQIDAVEIDPVIQHLGARDHPMHPYQDERVRVHLDDGRNFLRSTNEKYDLVIYALVDSLVLHSSYSNIRLESYLFTQQAFADIKRCLKPGGTFVTYNYFRQGWIVARLVKGLGEVFGAGNPLAFTFPFRKEVEPGESFDGFTVVFAGEGAERLRQAFYPEGGEREYWLREAAPTEQTPDGFVTPAEDVRRQWRDLSAAEQTAAPVRWWRVAPASTPQPAEPLRTASDDWPFLYLRGQFIPWLSLRGMAVMAALALGLLWLFTRNPSGKQAGWSFDGRMFFLGAGFMLVETKAVVHMALLFGSTWMVNSVVFFAVLVMILLANLFVLKVRPRRLWPYYAGLLATLALNCAVPLDWFLGLDRSLQILGSCLLVFAPILFAGVIFAVSFARTQEPNRAFGANIAGAMLGGLAENTSMLLGFQYLVLVALAFYVLSALLGRKTAAGVEAVC